MNQTRLGPRRWAFVVVAGGALLALPFTQRANPPRPAPPVETDVLASLEALAAAVTAPQSSTPAKATSASIDSHESAPPEKLPAWAQARHSPFDELMHQTAKVPEVPAPDVLPLQPLRPWITPPPSSKPSQVASDPSLQSSEGSLIAAQSPASVSPWSDDREELDNPPAVSDTQLASNQPRSQPASELSVNAWPDERFAAKQVAQSEKPPRQLQSAFVAPDQVLSQVAATAQVATVRPPAITRQAVGEPAMRSVAAPKIRFGQSHEATLPPEQSFVPPPNMQPLPSLPAARKSHVIFQPSQPSRLTANSFNP